MEAMGPRRASAGPWGEAQDAAAAASSVRAARRKKAPPEMGGAVQALQVDCSWVDSFFSAHRLLESLI